MRLLMRPLVSMDRLWASLRTIVSVVACAFAVFSAAVAQSTDDALLELGAPNDNAPAPLVQAPNAKPAMWRLADADTEIYLFGTFHILPPGINWRTDIYDRAMTASTTTIVEANLEGPDSESAMIALLSEYGYNPAGITLTDTIGVLRAQKLKEVAARFNLPGESLEAQRPWLALVTLSAVALKAAGFDELNGVETFVLKRAKTEGDNFDYLETLEDQIITLATLGDEDMLANFDATIAQFDNFEEYTQVMLDAWRAGDVEALDQSVLGELRQDSPKAFAALIVDRNRKWTTQIENFMAGEGDYFIAVGAGHLVGKDSVVDLLLKRGYTVERVQ